MSTPEDQTQQQVLESMSTLVYYNHHKGNYFIPNVEDQKRVRFIKMTETALKRYLKQLGISGKKGPDGLSEIDKKILHIQMTNYIDWCGPLAGRQAGFYPDKEMNLLVTSSPELIRPSKGPCKDIFKLLRKMLCKGDDDTQLKVFLFWAASAVQKLYNERNEPGHAIVFAGPANSGKSFLLNKVVVPLLGGRMAKPHRFMGGGTNFNAELCGSEVLAVDDEASSEKKFDRQNMEAQIKQITATASHRIEAKGMDAIMLSPFWRLVICLNENPQDLAVLPILNEANMDKINLLSVNGGDIFSMNPREKAEQIQQIENELPCFLRILLRMTKVTRGWEDSRFTFNAYQCPELARHLLGTENTERFIQLVTIAVNRICSGINATYTIEGSAAELYSRIKSILNDTNEELARELDNIRRFTGVDGFAQNLGYAYRSNPDGIIQKLGRSTWRLGRDPSTIKPHQIAFSQMAC